MTETIDQIRARFQPRTSDKPERLYVIVHDYVRGSTQAYPAERRNKLAMCRELGVVRAADPKAALERADEGKFYIEAVK